MPTLSSRRAPSRASILSSAATLALLACAGIGHAQAQAVTPDYTITPQFSADGEDLRRQGLPR